MANIKETNIEFQTLPTLMLINADEALKSMYVAEFGTDINMAISLAKSEGLKPTIDTFLNKVFDGIITVRKEYATQYKEIVDKLAKANKLPKKYGKQEIMSDIKKQGGTPTEAQRMLLKANDLRNLYGRVLNKGIKTQFSEDKLTDKECREIAGAIDVLLTRLKNV